MVSRLFLASDGDESTLHMCVLESRVDVLGSTKNLKKKKRYVNHRLVVGGIGSYLKCQQLTRVLLKW